MDQGSVFNVYDVLCDQPLEPGKSPQWIFTSTTDRATTNVVQADGQTAFRAHRHLEHDEIVFVLAEGSRFRIGDEVRPVRPGDVLHIPAGVLHGPLIPETGRFAAFSIYAPTFDPEHPDRVFEEEMEQS